MSANFNRHGKADADADHNHRTIFFDESDPGRIMPKSTKVGRCESKDSYGAVNTLDSLLKSYPTDRAMTDEEIAEVKQAMRKAGY